MKLAFVITNYNNSRYTFEFVNSINCFENYNEANIIIVDNNSNIDNRLILEDIEANNQNVKIIFLTENIGYFKGLNVGLKYLNENYPDLKHALIGNNDLTIPQEFFLQFSQIKEMFNTYPVISPNIIDRNGKHQNPHVIKSISKFREFIFDIYYSNYFFSKIVLFFAKHTRILTDRNDERNHNESMEIYQGHGSCYLIGPLFFKQFGELFAPTFLMGEEFFLAYQLQEKGYKIYYTPDVLVCHYGHASLSKVPGINIWKIAKKSHKIYKEYLIKYIKNRTNE
jgi:GT2 family glycosyltransferase